MGASTREVSSPSGEEVFSACKDPRNKIFPVPANLSIVAGSAVKVTTADLVRELHGLPGTTAEAWELITAFQKRMCRKYACVSMK